MANETDIREMTETSDLATSPVLAYATVANRAPVTRTIEKLFAYFALIAGFLGVSLYGIQLLNSLGSKQFNTSPASIFLWRLNFSTVIIQLLANATLIIGSALLLRNRRMGLNLILAGIATAPIWNLASTTLMLMYNDTYRVSTFESFDRRIYFIVYQLGILTVPALLISIIWLLKRERNHTRQMSDGSALKDS